MRGTGWFAKMHTVFSTPGQDAMRCGKQNIWVYDLSRETWTRLTSGTEPELLPTWTPDGEFLAFRSGDSLAWTRSDGSGKVERLAGVGRNVGPWTFSLDGKWLTLWPLQPGSDLFVAPVGDLKVPLRF